jgi:Ribonucleases P/MRP protein subunit Pop8
VTFIAYVMSALTVNQGLFGSAIPLEVVHIDSFECWLKLHKEYAVYKSANVVTNDAYGWH